MKLTKFQEVVQQKLQSADSVASSVLLVAPTGLGKTLAVTADLGSRRTRTIYGVPLRALAGSIADEIRQLQRNGEPIKVAVHHGSVQDSWLLSEEVAVTTYDQIVCAVPGLPLSLPLSAGHAVAGALLMSRLVLDEAHLAWGISPEALTILLGIVEFRQNLGLQTILMTATMPKEVAKTIADQLKMELIIAGDEDTKNDEALLLRNANRQVIFSLTTVKGRKSNEDKVDLAQLVDALLKAVGKRIYFANTVDRLQRMYDLLQERGYDMNLVTVLHNRMPGTWRVKAEEKVRERFGKDGVDGPWLLLTNQVAEAGLDISAPLVMSDPAPVDTLVQRAGRCARWFRKGPAEGTFTVISPAKAHLPDWALPYRGASVELALSELSSIIKKRPTMNWDAEREWIEKAWSGNKKKTGAELVTECLQRTTFALNLFDRASQQKSPGLIANTFREILSTEVAVAKDDESLTNKELLGKLKSNYHLDSSSSSMKRGYQLLTAAKGQARVVRYQQDELVVETNPSYLLPGELLIVPASVAYLHAAKGLCFGDGRQALDSILESELILKPQRQKQQANGPNPQSLWKHTKGVMNGVREKLLDDGDYRSALLKILEHLEPEKNSLDLANLTAGLAVLATGFHDLGKCGRSWQKRAHEIDPNSQDELIGRTANTTEKFGIPHTPPGFYASVAACNAAIKNVPEADHLVRAIALAAARHHSSLLDPSRVRGYQFEPVEASSGFVAEVLKEVGLNLDAATILHAARSGGTASDVPLMLPNDDLFAIYALVGRAVLISDREDAAGQSLEDWRSTQNA